MLVWSLTLYLIDEPMALLYSNLHHYTDITFFGREYNSEHLSKDDMRCKHSEIRCKVCKNASQLREEKDVGLNRHRIRPRSCRAGRGLPRPYRSEQSPAANLSFNCQVPPAGPGDKEENPSGYRIT